MSNYKENELIIVPFGKEGHSFVDTLLTHGYRIRTIWDNHKSGTYRGIPICKPSNMSDNHVSVILCASSDITEKAILEQLHALGVSVQLAKDFLQGLDLTEQEYANNYVILHRDNQIFFSDKDEEQLVLNSLELPITERCSLKCRDCCNLMQYFTHPQDEDVEKLLSDADQLLNAVDHIEELRLLGGEPFVSTQLYRYVEHFLNQEKISFIHIFSNGTILPRGKNLECLKNKKVFVNISNYGSLSKQIPEIERVFQEEGIFFRVTEMTEWTNCGFISKHNRTPEQQEAIFHNCCASTLLTLKQGRLYICPFLASAHALHAIPEEDDESLLISKYKSSELRQQIRTLLQKSYFIGCDYCAGRPQGVTNIPAAIQTKTPLNYQKY